MKAKYIELMDCPLHQLNTNTLMTLKLELLKKVKEINDELTLQEMAQGCQ